MNLQFLVYKNNHDFSRHRYVIRFICRILGYPYQIAHTWDQVTQDGIVISYLSDGEIGDYLNVPILNIFNSQQLYKLDDAEKIVTLFEWKNISIPTIGKQSAIVESSAWRKDDINQYFSKNGKKLWSTKYDILLNIFYHLSRYEEKWRHFTEETATDYSTSILSRYQSLNIPAVDILIHYFSNLIRQKFDQNKQLSVRILPWPRSEDFGIAFTHDVDLTRGASLKTRALHSSFGWLYQLTGKKKRLELEKQELDEKDAQIWSFPEIISFYKKKGWLATFFFLSKMFEGLHFRYNISSKKFLKLFKDLGRFGHEIALHSSLKSFDHPTRYTEEKKKLESITSGEVVGLRQHYLRAKFPRLWKLASISGFKYDTSLSYNYQAGFRGGTSHPFFTYDWTEEKQLPLLEFSLAFFENNLEHTEENTDKVKKIISNLIEQTSQSNGLLVALIHPSNFLVEPYQEWWSFLIKQLENYSIYVNTLNGHYEWIQFKDQIKIKIIKLNSEKVEIGISKPKEITNFSLELMGRGKFECEKGIQTELLSENCYHIRTNRKRFRATVTRKNR